MVRGKPHKLFSDATEATPSFEVDPRNISVVEWEEGEKMAVDARPQRYGSSSDPSSVWHFADSDGVELKWLAGTEPPILSLP